MSTSGQLFPTIFPQAARATSLCLDASGSVVVGALGQSSSPAGSGSALGPQILAYSLSSNEWNLGPSLGVLGTSLAGVETGWALDSYLGLFAWGGGNPASGNAPYISLVSGASGVYAVGPTDVWNQAGILVAGSTAISDCVAALGSGTSIYALAADSLYTLTLTTSAAATVTSASVPAGMTATCMGPITGGGLGVGGWTPATLASGAYAMAMSPSLSVLLAFPGSAQADSWILSGTPPAFSLLASTTGLPAYSTSLAAAFTRAGTQVLLNDPTNNTWASFSYIGGVLGLLSSGSLTGQVAGVVDDSSSSYALIATPGSSGYYALYLNGPSWAASGQVAGGLSACCAPHLLSGQTWAVGWAGSPGSGSLGLLSYSTVTNSWTLSPMVTGLPIVPTWLVSDQGSSTLWVSASGSTEVFALGAVAGVPGTSAGTWAASLPTTTVGPPIVTRLQFLMATAGPNQVAAAGPASITGISPQSTLGLPATPTALAGPFLDGTLAVSTSGSILLYHLAAPWLLEPNRFGEWSAWSGGAFGPVQSLGAGQVPTAFVLNPSGNPFLATSAGFLGALSGAPGSLVATLASGGFSSGLQAPNDTWLVSTVGGQLAVIEGSGTPLGSFILGESTLG